MPRSHPIGFIFPCLDYITNYAAIQVYWYINGCMVKTPLALEPVGKNATADAMIYVVGIFDCLFYALFRTKIKCLKGLPLNSNTPRNFQRLLKVTR